MATLIARVRVLDPQTLDAALAVAFSVAYCVETAVFADGDVAALALCPLAVAGFATLSVRRTRPLLPAIALPAAFIVISIFAPEVFIKVASTYLALMLVMYSLGRYQRGFLPAIWVTGAIVVLALVSGGAEDPGQAPWVLVLAGGPFVFGRALRNRTRLQAELRVRTEQIERDRELRARRAVEDERDRLAGELQAVIANGVSAMVVQAETVPRLIGSGESDRAARALQVIEDTGRDSLAEMRRLLGVLRRRDDGPALAPQPTLAEVGVLAERVRGDGVDVDVVYEGDPVGLALGADLAAYRVVEEALDAAASEGASKVTIVIGYGQGELSLDVRDDRGELATGTTPLLAMRERLGLYGGRVRVIEDDDGVRVQARLPLNGARA